LRSGFVTARKKCVDVCFSGAAEVGLPGVTRLTGITALENAETGINTMEENRFQESHKEVDLLPASGAAGHQLLVQVLAQMAKGLLDRSKGTPSAVVEAGEDVPGSKSVTNGQGHVPPPTGLAQVWVAQEVDVD
jgi:hypothetical protein